MECRFKRWPLPMLLLAGLQGCVSPTPHWDARFGAANRANLAAQAIDPAAANANPASGIDGRAARAAYERYQRSFVEAGQPPAALVRDR